MKPRDTLCETLWLNYYKYVIKHIFRSLLYLLFITSTPFQPAGGGEET